MKRSRACEDLCALECSSSSAPAATTSNNNSITGQRGVKRSKRHVEMVDSGFNDVEELSDSFLASIRVVDAAENSMQQHLDALEFVMGMSSNYDRLSAATACFDECLPPIRRNSRDVMPVVECDASSRSALQFKKKLQLGGAESSMMMVDSVDAPASDILCSRYQLETRCMDPLDKRQSLPFDMSSFIMLSINPNRATCDLLKVQIQQASQPGIASLEEVFIQPVSGSARLIPFDLHPLRVGDERPSSAAAGVLSPPRMGHPPESLCYAPMRSHRTDLEASVSLQEASRRTRGRRN